MHWDSMVTMPQTDEHHQARGEQSEVIAAVIHEKSTSPKIGKLIDEVRLDEERRTAGAKRQQHTAHNYY